MSILHAWIFWEMASALCWKIHCGVSSAHLLCNDNNTCCLCLAFTSLWVFCMLGYSGKWHHYSVGKFTLVYKVHIRAGELPKKIRSWVQTRHMGLKNVPKKFGTPGPNLAPNLFGLFVQGQITKAGTPKWTHRTQWIWIYVKIIYDFLNFSLFTPPLLNKFLTLLVNWTSKTRLQG